MRNGICVSLVVVSLAVIPWPESALGAKPAKRGKVPCKLIYKQYEAKRQFNLKLLGSEVSASTEPISSAKVNENDTQLRRDMYTLCEQFNATDMTVSDFYARRAEIEQKHRDVEKGLGVSLDIKPKVTAEPGRPNQ